MNAKKKLLGLLAIGLVIGSFFVDDLDIDIPGIDKKVTSVTYVFEKDTGAAIPSPVLFALNKINREQKIPATVLEYDTTDGDSQVADQYKPVVEAVTKDDLPAVVALAGTDVVKVVKSPKTENEVLDLVK